MPLLCPRRSSDKNTIYLRVNSDSKVESCTTGIERSVDTKKDGM